MGGQLELLGSGVSSIKLWPGRYILYKLFLGPDTFSKCRVGSSIGSRKYLHHKYGGPTSLAELIWQETHILINVHMQLVAMPIEFR
jgi:hypothetical protein